MSNDQRERQPTARDQARELFSRAGLTYAVVTRESLAMLRSRINQRMKESGLISGSFRCRQRGSLRETPHGTYAEIKCRSYYFDNREAVSFNTDGFIGFAGWADDRNVQPVLAGFSDWVRDMDRERQP